MNNPIDLFRDGGDGNEDDLDAAMQHQIHYPPVVPGGDEDEEDEDEEVVGEDDDDDDMDPPELEIDEGEELEIVPDIAPGIGDDEEEEVDVVANDDEDDDEDEDLVTIKPQIRSGDHHQQFGPAAHSGTTVALIHAYDMHSAALDAQNREEAVRFKVHKVAGVSSKHMSRYGCNSRYSFLV